MIKRGFTLIELLVVIAIIAILAAILFPVFAQAKAAAKTSVSVSNNKQITLGALMYMGDYDDHFMIAAYNNSYRADPPIGPDAVPLQMAYPYIKNLKIMCDPMDIATDADRYNADGELTDPKTVAPAYQAAQTLLNWCAVADWGTNYQYLNPTYYNPATGAFQQTGISQTEIVRPGNVYMALSSVWNRRASGAPYGGGNAGVDPPCVWDTTQPDPDTRPGHPTTYSYGYYWYGGWQPTAPLSWNVFGGVWPWHSGGKVVIISYCDGHAKSAQITSLTTGCNVLDGWGGTFNAQKAQYSWATTF